MIVSIISYYIIYHIIPAGTCVSMYDSSKQNTAVAIVSYHLLQSIHHIYQAVLMILILYIPYSKVGLIVDANLKRKRDLSVFDTAVHVCGMYPILYRRSPPQLCTIHHALACYTAVCVEH